MRQCSRLISRSCISRSVYRTSVNVRLFSKNVDKKVPETQPATKSTPRKVPKKMKPLPITPSDMSMLLGSYDEEYLDIDISDRKSVHAVCSADSYDLQLLYSHLSGEYESCKMFANKVIRFSPMSGKECFIFQMGTLVGWGFDLNEFNDIKAEIKRFEINPLASSEYEEIEYAVRPDQDHSVLSTQMHALMLIGGDQSEQNMFLDQLAFSHGVANSVKLAVLENQLESFIGDIGHLPVFLKQGRRVPLTRTQALRKLGELLQFRAVLNLQSDLLETPDLYWNYSKLEEHFLAISTELDIKKRVDTLNKKLDYAKDIAELLKDYLSERHSLSLEWCIIVLIAVEVGFELLHFADRYYFV